jgi:hypothetical protein
MPEIPEVPDRPSLAVIREKLGQFKGVAEPKEFLSSTTVPGGVPRGVLCEITGSARTEWVLEFMKCNEALTVFWAEEKLTLLPTGLQQRGIDLNRVLLAETGSLLFQALRKALRSKLFDCVVLPGEIDEVRMLKALQLFARESNAFVFFLSKIPKNAWAIPFQLEVAWTSGVESYSAVVLKSKWTACKDSRQEGA